MTGMIKIKNLLVLVMIMLASVAMTSCIGDSKEEEPTPQKAENTGLCGGVWHLKELSSDFGMNLQIDENDTYVFDLTGSGVHQYTNPDTNEVESMNFTWKSYFFSGSTNRLVLKYELYGDMEFVTIYTIDALGQLVISVNDNDGHPCVAYYTMEKTPAPQE